MKIFLTTMSMGIGGAETHIFELALALIGRGYDVTIVSVGGDLLPRLIEKGIKHIYAPMNSRSLKSIFDSYKILCNAIKNEKPDLIHAHARIPALISHYAAKKFNIPFVTTDHGKFDTSFFTTLLTRWGDKTLAVSDDLKQYLVDNYNIKSEDIFLTINGIDTDEFSPDIVPQRKLLEELGIPHNAKIVLNVSRLDTTAFRSAEELIEIAPDLYRIDNNTRILIVGDGDLYNNIKQKADKINDKLGINYIIMPGKRTDINEICAISHVFCGVSRAALEAAASGKPILLAGNGAYFGILNEKNIKEAENYNFTCRGIIGFDKNQFLKDIVFCLQKDQEIIENAQFLRNYILKNLSSQRMADDTESVYYNALRKKGRYDCVLLGYYGFGNMGDDALLLSVIKNLRKKIPYLRIAVLSNNVKIMRAKLSVLDVDVYNRFNPFTSIFKKTDNLIFGGGTLLQDNTSTKSLLYYLFMIKRAINNNMNVILYANGIGPIKKEKNRNRIKRILPYLSLITARDSESYDYIKSLSNSQNISLTADEALTIVPSGSQLIQTNDFYNQDFICVSVRKCRCISEKEYGEYIAEISDFCKCHGLSILFIIMEKRNDFAITTSLSSMVDVPFEIIFNQDDINGEELTAIISKSKMTVSVRLHSLIFSACAGIPMIGLVYDPKVSAFLRLAEVPEKYIVDIGDNSKLNLRNAMNDLFYNIENEKIRLKNKINSLKKSAELNAEITADFLKKGKMEK